MRQLCLIGSTNSWASSRVFFFPSNIITDAFSLQNIYDLFQSVLFIVIFSNNQASFTRSLNVTFIGIEREKRWKSKQFGELDRDVNANVSGD